MDVKQHGRDAVQIGLRVPDWLREDLKNLAADNGRSINAEIVRILEEAVSKSSLQSNDKFVLRLPQGFRDHIKSAAKANNRSMNAEIVHILAQHYCLQSDSAGE